MTNQLEGAAERPRSCWCKCGCEDRWECDPCRMNDHITMTSADWHEVLANRDQWLEEDDYDY